MMRSCLFLVCLTYLIIGCSPKNIRSNPGAIINQPADTALIKEYIFPEDWLGYWTGDLEIYDANGLKQIVPMSLDLSETDTSDVYTWAIIYGQDSTAQRRDYQLKEIDATTGHYLIDEKNGIILDAYHLHNELNSVFEVMGNTLLTSYKREKNEMIFSVKLFPSTAIRVSGDTLIANQDIPKVNSYQLTVSQTARLNKIIREN